ncbi:hypothetical protein CF161_20269 [Pseudomonas sp. CF161]|nr:hypothetical protein CF161_20269 [Pseudomonas sp. CF161]
MPRPLLASAGVSSFEGCLEICTVGAGDFVEGLISQCREYVLVEVGADFVKGRGCEALFFFGLEPSFSSSSKRSSLGRIDCSFSGSFLLKGIGATTHYFA